jgi:hypothetical protein
MNLENLCNPKGSDPCTAPFELRFLSKSWVGATDGHALLLIDKLRSGIIGPLRTLKDPEACVAAITPKSPLNVSEMVTRKKLTGWAQSARIPKIGQLGGLTVDRELLRKFLNEIPDPLGPYGKVVMIQTYGAQDVIRITGPDTLWFLALMPYTLGEGDDINDTAPDVFQVADAEYEAPPPTAVKPAVVKPVLPSKAAQALMQLHGSSFLRDKTGAPINKWGDPVRGRYR